MTENLAEIIVVLSTKNSKLQSLLKQAIEQLKENSDALYAITEQLEQFLEEANNESP